MPDAKKKPAAKKPAAKAKTKDAVKKAEGFGVPYLAKKNDKEEATIRGNLRKAGVKPAGKSYSWATKEEADKAWSKVSKAA